MYTDTKKTFFTYFSKYMEQLLGNMKEVY